MAGPLQGVRIIELAGIGPCPFAAMLLADLGAEVIRVDRLGPTPTGVPFGPDRGPVDAATDAPGAAEPGAGTPGPSSSLFDPTLRSRPAIAVDLKSAAGRDLVLRLVGNADAFIEGFRPGVTERLGLGPGDCLAVNPKLVYGRMTGWGQDGPLARTAGHDINYIALAGVLDSVGRAGEPPVPPLNLVGDYGGGGMLLAVGVLAGIIHARAGGTGQVVDAAMVDGAALLATFIHGLRAMGRWPGERGTNLLDTGAHFYEVYECADGKHVAVGAIEPQFYSELVRRTGFEADIPETDRAGQFDAGSWPARKKAMAALFATRPRAEWCDLLEGTDACFAPVLSMAEAPAHPHLAQRGTFADVGGVVQPGPAPRFSATPLNPPTRPGRTGDHTDAVLSQAGVDQDEVIELRRADVIR
ncbi:MAG: CaiB/BaiF CoA transferase family protein [Frankiaceae bacterium]